MTEVCRLVSRLLLFEASASGIVQLISPNAEHQQQGFSVWQQRQRMQLSLRAVWRDAAAGAKWERREVALHLESGTSLSASLGSHPGDGSLRTEVTC